MTITKPIWRTKTFWYGIAVAALPFLLDLQTFFQGIEGVPGWLVTLIGVGIVLLRRVTSRPATFSGEPKAKF